MTLVVLWEERREREERKRGEREERKRGERKRGERKRGDGLQYGVGRVEEMGKLE